MADSTKIIVIDRIEEVFDKKGKRYLKVTDKEGTTRNFKEGRTELLTNKESLLSEGSAIEIKLRDYINPEGNVFPFVYDFTLIKDQIQVNEAVLKAPQEAKQLPKEPVRARDRELSMATAYSKDLVCAGKLSITKMFNVAEIIYFYIAHGMTVEEANTRLRGLKETKEP